VLDVFGDQTLERFELLVELFGWDLAVGLATSEDPWRGIDGGAPRNLVGVRSFSALERRLARLRDRVQIDVAKAVALFLVEFNPRPAALKACILGLADRRPEGSPWQLL
jgi:hypothetical protein